MLNQLGVEDRGWINTTQPLELLYWMDQLHADAEMVKEAVNAVGPDEDKVRAHLHGRRLLQ